MAISKNGLHGWPSGKLGGIVYYMLKGRPVQRTIGKPGKPSLKQKANHQSMAVTTRFLRNLKGFLNNGYELEARGTIRNQHNLAVSSIKKTALQGEYPNISIDYAKVQLSKGTLSGPKEVHMEKVEGGIQVTWDPKHYTGTGAQYDDCLQLALCFPDNNRKKLELSFGRRHEGTAFLPLASEDMDRSMELYLFFRAANNDSVSDTVYLGNLNGSYVNPIITERKEKEKAEDLKLTERYDTVNAQYRAQMKLKPGDRIGGKAFRNLEKEFLVLTDKIRDLESRRLPNGSGLPLNEEALPIKLD